MKKYLIFKDNTSDKFWQIETEGKSFKVTYGRSGTAGVTQVKAFATAEKCETEAMKLVLEKMKKGYKETNPDDASTNTKATSVSSNSDYKSIWESLANSNDQQKVLMEHFDYLSDSETSLENLQSILSHVKEISVTKEGELCLKLDLENLYLVATAPNENVNQKWPKSLQEYQKHHEFITLTDRKNITYLTLGDTGTLDRSALAENMGSDKFKKVISPVSEISDWWIYHPIEKTDSGEPVIYYVDHEEMEAANAQEINAGALFLMRCVDLLKDEKPSVKQSAFTPIVTIQTLLGSGLRYFIDNANLLEFSGKRLNKMKFDSGEFKHITFTEALTIDTATEIYVNQEKIIIRGSDQLNILTFSKTEIKKAADFSFSKNCHAPAYYNGRIFFYDSDTKSFMYCLLSENNDVKPLQTNIPNDSLEIKDSVLVNDFIVFADRRFLFGFTQDPNTLVTSELFKTRMKYTNPKLVSVPNSSFLIIIDVDLITFYQIGKSPMMLVGERSKGPIEAFMITENSFIALAKHTYETEDKTITIRQITLFSLGDFPRLKLQRDLPSEVPTLDHVSNIARHSNDLFLIEPDGSITKVSDFFH